MKTKFICGLTLFICLLVMFLFPFQSPAHTDECAVNCESSTVGCLENTPAMDPDQRQERTAYCEKKNEECLSGCSQPQDTQAQDTKPQDTKGRY
jgi:hypothetical protein